MKKQRIDIRKSKHAKSGLHDMCRYLKRDADVYSIVEIGTFTGNSTEVFLQYFDHIVCVDPWESNFDQNDVLSDSNNFDMTEVYRQFKETVIDKAPDRIQVMKMTSEEAVYSFDDMVFDFVYIDGNHQESFVRNDIKLWLPKVKAGGFIGGHDYGSKKYPHVKSVVDSYFDNVITFKDSSWVTRKQ